MNSEQIGIKVVNLTPAVTQSHLQSDQQNGSDKLTPLYYIPV